MLLAPFVESGRHVGDIFGGSVGVDVADRTICRRDPLGDPGHLQVSPRGVPDGRLKAQREQSSGDTTHDRAIEAEIARKKVTVPNNESAICSRAAGR